MKMRMRMR
jgi:hypothetical protein